MNVVCNNYIHILQLGRMGKKGKEAWPGIREERDQGKRMERGEWREEGCNVTRFQFVTCLESGVYVLHH